MYFSEIKKQIKTYNRRSIILLTGKLSLLSLLGWKLFDLQIIKSNKYKIESKSNQISIEIIYPLRGEIKDRNNIKLATNIKTYDLYLIPEQSEDINKTLNNLDKLIDIDFTKKRKVIELSKKIKKFERIQIFENLSWQDLELIQSNLNELPGLHLILSPKRIYPYSNYFSHILGYINKPTKEEINLPYISNMPSLDIGKTGIEKYKNESLVGLPGKREIEVNAFGREIREINVESSQQGSEINLTIDSRIQKFASNELNNHKAGSVVVMDVNSGEIIAMTSAPNYNPNLIISKPNQKYWDSIINNTLSPLTHRSVQGLYSPGSTFKMIVALAGLKKNLINLNDKALCSGKIEFGDRLYHCWKTKGHGLVNMDNAIKESCDVFFYELSKKVGIDDIAKMAFEFGLGQKFDFGFENEKKGIIPSKKWKKEKLKESWYAGETLINAIGQGYILSTPLQLAVMTSRIASNGKKIEPSIIKSKNIKEFDKIDLSQKNINLIKQSMYKVVNEVRGTANKSKSNLYEFSGKTGTSQVKKITIQERESEDFRKVEKEWKNKDHALFVGFTSSDNPKYAISVIIEHGGSGASVAAPIAKKVFDFMHELEI